MAWLWSFLAGGIIGFFIMGIYAGGAQNEKLRQAFDDGFNAGKQYKG